MFDFNNTNSMSFKFLFVFYLTIIFRFAASNYCGFDNDRLQLVLTELENNGYDIIQGTHKYLFNSTEFGANPNGIYGIYQFDFLDVERSYFWFIPGHSAIIFHNCSPPSSAYFSYRSYVGDGLEEDLFPIAFASMGDSINQLTINFTNIIDNNNNQSPFDALITIVTTPDQITFKDISNAFNKYNLSKTVNLDSVPTFEQFKFGKNKEFGPFGENQSAVFTFLSRIAIPFDIPKYIEYINQTYPVYFVNQLNTNLVNQTTARESYPYPILKNRVSNLNINEFQTVSINQSLSNLNQSIINYFVSKQNMGEFFFVCSIFKLLSTLKIDQTYIIFCVINNYKKMEK